MLKTQFACWWSSKGFHGYQYLVHTLKLPSDFSFIFIHTYLILLMRLKQHFVLQ